MMRLDFPLFLGVATAAHLALWPDLDLSGPAGGGAGGEDSVTLAASAPVADLVNRWETPPDTVSAAPMLAPPEATAAPKRPDAETPKRPLPRPDPMQQAGVAPRLPQVAAPPPTPQAPEMTAAALPMPRIEDAPDAPPRPARPADPATPMTLSRPDPPRPPQIDTAAAAPDSPLAPTRSIQPPARPAERRAPAPAPAQPAPAQPAQTAAGPAANDAAGPAATQASQGTGRATTQRLMAQWGSGVQRAIERRKRYPRGTHASGTVRLRLTLNGAGQLTGIGLAASSGHAALDQAAIAAVRAARYPAAPEALGPGPHAFTVPLSFRP